MREVSLIYHSMDYNFVPNHILGLPMVGWAMHAPYATPSITPPSSRGTVERCDHNHTQVVLNGKVDKKGHSEEERKW